MRVALDRRPVPRAEERERRERRDRRVERAGHVLAVLPPPEPVARRPARRAARGEAVGVPGAVVGHVAREPVEPGLDGALGRRVASDAREGRGPRRAGARPEEARDGPRVPGGIRGGGGGAGRTGGASAARTDIRARGDERRHRPEERELAGGTHASIVQGVGRDGPEDRSGRRGDDGRCVADRPAPRSSRRGRPPAPRVRLRPAARVPAAQELVAQGGGGRGARGGVLREGAHQDAPRGPAGTSARRDDGRAGSVWAWA